MSSTVSNTHIEWNKLSHSGHPGHPEPNEERDDA